MFRLVVRMVLGGQESVVGWTMLRVQSGVFGEGGRASHESMDRLRKWRN